MNTQQLLLEQWNEYKRQLKMSVDLLVYSENKCKNIDIYGVMTDEEFESFEAFTSRFARTSDILTQKTLKALCLLLRQEIGTFLDMARFLEKIKIVDQAEDLLQIRDLRNAVAHEYSGDIYELFDEIRISTPLLKKILDRALNYDQEL